MFEIPSALKWLDGSCDGRRWLRELPERVQACADQWSLRLESPYQDSQVSIVFPVSCEDTSHAVLKVQFPHSECEHEAEALKLWNGQGAVRLLAHNQSLHALLTERCEPGDHLSRVGADEALDVFLDLLPRLSIKANRPFASLSEESERWAEQLPVAWERAGRPCERELLDAALQALGSLPGSQSEQVLLHQDLHGDNVLRATREPWLVIDPKPLVGEREFSIAPIIRDYDFGHSREHVVGRLDRLACVLRLDRDRARLWAMAQTLAWAFESKVIDRHLETARWLWQA
jgi:streptomycin 6-kinase